MKNKSSKLSNEQLVVTSASGKGKVSVNYSIIKRAALTLRAFNNPLRKKLLEAIEGKSGITVTELYKKLKFEQSVCSMQLGILRRAGLVNAKREGKKIHYSINGKRIAEVAEIADKMAQDE